MNAILKLRRNKFGARPVTTADGYFASTAEYRRWVQLKALEKAGQIRGLTRQPKFPLYTVDLAGKRVPVRIGRRDAQYSADFAYYDQAGKYRVEDVKGMDTRDSKLRRGIVEASLGIKVEVIR